MPPAFSIRAGNPSIRDTFVIRLEFANAKVFKAHHAMIVRKYRVILLLPNSVLVQQRRLAIRFCQSRNLTGADSGVENEWITGSWQCQSKRSRWNPGRFWPSATLVQSADPWRTPESTRKRSNHCETRENVNPYTTTPDSEAGQCRTGNRMSLNRKECGTRKSVLRPFDLVAPEWEALAGSQLVARRRLKSLPKVAWLA